MISKEEVQNLAELARLKISSEEVLSLQKDISEILEYVGQVSAASKEGETVLPVVRNVLREDAPRQEGHMLAGKEEVLRNAFPEKEREYNKVRKIIQKDE